MKLWIDEDLSPSLVQVGHEAGYHATSVRDRGKLSSKDHALVPILLDEEWVLVTNNAGDFLKLAVKAGLHSGLVFVELGSAAAEAEWLSAVICPTQPCTRGRAAQAAHPATADCDKVGSVEIVLRAKTPEIGMRPRSMRGGCWIGMGSLSRRLPTVVNCA